MATRDIESQFAERLRYFSAIRRSFISFLQSRIPFISFLEQNTVFHAVLFLSTFTIFIGIFEIIRNLTLFSFHPVFMTIGVFIFIAEGIVSYRNHFLLESFSPIMQHNKKVKARAIHQTCQAIGATFILLGFLVILSEKFEYKKPFLPQSIHAVVATLTLIIVAVQLIVGQQRVDQPIYNSQYKRWHNDFGFLLWDLLCLCVFTGLAHFLDFGLFNFLLLWVPWIVWLTVVLQMYSKANRREDFDRSLDDYEASNKLSNNFGSNSNLPGLAGDIEITNNEAENVDENSTFLIRQEEEK